MIAALTLAGCASRRTYVDDWVEAPVPASEDARQAECRNIRPAMAHEEGASRAAAGAAMANPMLVMAVQNEARRRMALLETRAADLHCYAAFSSAPAEAHPIDRYDQLTKLQKLHEDGVVTDQEYEREKAKILDR